MLYDRDTYKNDCTTWLKIKQIISVYLPKQYVEKKMCYCWTKEAIDLVEDALWYMIYLRLKG